MKVELNTKITPELLSEGNFNEFEHILAQKLKQGKIPVSDNLIPREIVYQSLQEARKICLEDIEKYKKYF